MKSTKFLLTALLAIGSGSLFAQTGIQSGTKFGHGEDSIRCITNISLYEPYAKAKDYKEALPYWELAYAECPAASKNLYINGVKIVEWQIKNAKTVEEKTALVDKLMGVYDNRIKYFGKDRQWPTSRILGNKAVDYLSYMGDKADYSKAYEWLTESVNARQGASSPEVTKDWVMTSEKMFKKDPNLREEYINTYLKGVEYLDAYAQANNKEQVTNYVDQVKSVLTNQFAASGAADCEAMQNLYATKIAENKDNIDFLKKTVALFKRARCQDTDAYFLASEYAHKIEPTMESAQGMARQALKKDDIPAAITYFKEAGSLATDAKDKAEIDLSIASLYFKRREYATARTYARKSLESDPNQATPYMLIATMYAQDARSIYPNDPIMAQAVYYAAVDQLEKAKQAEPGKAAEVNSVLSSYRQMFPKPEDVFMHQELEKGKSVTIGGWIQERTTVR